MAWISSLGCTHELNRSTGHNNDTSTTEDDSNNNNKNNDNDNDNEGGNKEVANNVFIDQIAALCQSIGPKYNILVNSPVIAQAILESASGTSELAVNAKNYFGLKFKKTSQGAKRCPTALDTPYIKVGSEQDASTGQYVSSSMEWFQFKSMEDCVTGYYDFINISTYSNLKGVTYPETYCTLIKQDGYATSIDYTQKLMNVINSYNLTKYDTYNGGSSNMGEIKLKLALGAGHYKYTEGKRCNASLDPNETREWYLNDRICDKVEAGLDAYEGVLICRLDDTTGDTLVDLPGRKAAAEKFGADIYISVHHNAGVGCTASGGTQVYCYWTDKNRAEAKKIYDAVVAQTGLVGNRSEKVANGNHLYECYAPTMDSYIIENGFMDSTTDVPIILTDAHAEKTAKGIVNFLVERFQLVKKSSNPNPNPNPDPNPEPSMVFVSVEEIKTEQLVAVTLDTLSAVANSYGVTADFIIQSNPGLYKLTDTVYLVNKDTVIYVGNH